MMKKVMSLFVAVLALILVTGCGNNGKTITCSQDVMGQEMTIAATTDKDDKVTKVKMEMSMKANSEEEAKAAVASLELGKAAYEGKEGIKVNVSRKGVKAIMTIEADLTKASKEDLEELDMAIEDADLTGANFKKNAEDEGATCK